MLLWLEYIWMYCSLENDDSKTQTRVASDYVWSVVDLTRVARSIVSANQPALNNMETYVLITS